MEQDRQKKWRYLRGAIAILGLLLILAIGLPSTGTFETGPFHRIVAADTQKPITEWRIDIMPDAFFGVIAAGLIPLIFILFGLCCRKRAVEIIGWSLYGVLILCFS